MEVRPMRNLSQQGFLTAAWQLAGVLGKKNTRNNPPASPLEPDPTQSLNLTLRKVGKSAKKLFAKGLLENVMSFAVALRTT